MSLVRHGEPTFNTADNATRLDFDLLDEEWWPRETECDAEARAQRACSRRRSMIATHAPFIDER